MCSLLCARHPLADEKQWPPRVIGTEVHYYFKNILHLLTTWRIAWRVNRYLSMHYQPPISRVCVLQFKCVAFVFAETTAPTNPAGTSAPVLHLTLMTELQSHYLHNILHLTTWRIFLHQHYCVNRYPLHCHHRVNRLSTTYSSVFFKCVAPRYFRHFSAFRRPTHLGKHLKRLPSHTHPGHSSQTGKSTVILITFHCHISYYNARIDTPFPSQKTCSLHTQPKHSHPPVAHSLTDYRTNC